MEMNIEMYCPHCGEWGQPLLHRQRLAGGDSYHIRASCANCGRWLRYLPHPMLTREERERLPWWQRPSAAQDMATSSSHDMTISRRDDMTISRHDMVISSNQGAIAYGETRLVASDEGLLAIVHPEAAYFCENCRGLHVVLAPARPLVVRALAEQLQYIANSLEERLP